MDPKYNKKYPEEKAHFMLFCRFLNYLKITKFLCDFIEKKEVVKEFEGKLAKSIYNDDKVYDIGYRKKLTKKYALHKSLLENPQYDSPYFKTTQLDRLNAEMYYIKSLKKQTLGEFLININEIPVVIEKDDLEPINEGNLRIYQQPEDDYQWAQNEFLLQVKYFINMTF
jgi:hypothetical protein